MYNFIYYIIFAILSTLLLIYIESKYSNAQQSTKVVEIDGVQYIIPDITIKERDPDVIKNIGSKLTCESLNEILGQKIKHNSYVPDARSMISGEYLYVDCHEPNTNIMVDYKPKDMFSYEGRDNINNNFYDFYNRLALDSLKKDKIIKSKSSYIEVPYTVDLCEYKKDKYVCDEQKTFSQRKEKIKQFLKNEIMKVF